MDIQGYLETVRLLPRSSKCDEEAIAEKSQKEIDQKYSVWMVLVALGFMYSVHNLIAPNMTAIAKLFHFNNYERDAYIGGELTLFFYFPGVFGALLSGILSGVLDRRLLLAALAILTSIACLLTARVGTFGELAWARAMTGFGIGGSLPVVYSLVGDWFPAKKRASASAFVSAASGCGVFVGQCVATITGSVDWRWPFLVIALPSAITGILIFYFCEEPVRGGQEEGIETQSLYSNSGYMPVVPTRQLRALLHNRTNMFVILQAFPGNIPWGVIIVYIHDFLVQDLGLSTRSALGSIAILAGSAFVGVLTGGFIGESLYGANSKYLAIFGGACNIFRAVPFFIIFGWKEMFGPLAKTSETAFFLLLMLGGFFATMASAGTGAMLLNVNLPEMRGSVMAMYSVLDDLSKGFGTLFVSMIVRLVGGRAVAYQLSLLLWVFTGVALLYTWHTYEEDEAAMRKNLDEAAKESMVLMSKHRAQQAIRDRAKAAGAAHLQLKSEKPRGSEYSWGFWTQSSKPPSDCSTSASQPGNNSDTASTHSSSSSSRGRGRPPLSAAAAASAAEQRDRLRRAARAAAEAAAHVR
jgi:MFS family permease